ncbi:FUSC family protein [Micromonospora sp. RTP1Z1]|uniref:FUSC family protein n=1 Tax=Micromonospora sp. RTP1Z1 TaxID=2994043 RepID=UPI0029C683B8|nr:FUSC family protein [Micromonospora sp. RTP1Z1]
MKPARWPHRSAFDTAGPGLLRHRLRVAAPLIAQCALMAGLAWWISQSLFGHATPIFAATVALICLTAGMGGRGRQAVDLFVGVLAGVLVGEGVRALRTGNTFWLIVPAIALAMAMAALIDPRPLTYIQAGTAVLIVVTVGASSSPVDYLVDAAVGGLVGLLGSQVLFTPDPLKLVETPVREILSDTADALRTGAEALRRGSVAQARDACEHARDAHARLGELSGARAAARRVTGRTVRGRRRVARLRRADRPLDDVDVLVAAVLLLCDDVQTRLVRAGSPASDPLPARLTGLADGVAELAARPLPAMAPAMTAPPDRLRRSADLTPPTQDVPATDVHLHDARTALHRLQSPPDH